MKNNRRSSKGSDGKVEQIKIKTSLYDRVRDGDEERPLGEKLPDGFEVKDKDGLWAYGRGYEPLELTGAIELHRLVLEDYDQLEKQKDEITSTIIDSTCSFNMGRSYYKEVSQPPLPSSPGHATALCVHCSVLFPPGC